MGVVWRGVAWWAKSETVSDLARDKPTPLRPVAVDSPGRLSFFLFVIRLPTVTMLMEIKGHIGNGKDNYDGCFYQYALTSHHFKACQEY